MNKHFPLFLLFFIVLLGAVLRICGLNSRSVWLDEAWCIKLAEMNIQDLVRIFLTPGEVRLHPPLYFILLHFFLYLGDNDFIARLPSAIFGLSANLLVYKVGTLLFGLKEGLISAFLLSISILHVRHSREAVMYSQFMFFFLLSIFLFYRAVKENDTRLWIGFIISTLMGLYTHYYTLFLVLIEIPFFIYMVNKDRTSIIISLANLSKKKILVLILTLLVASIFLFPIFEAASNLIKKGQLGSKYGIPRESFFQNLFEVFSNGWVGSLLFIPTFLIGLLSSIKERRESTALLLSWVFIPIIIVLILVSIFGERARVTDRYIIFILPGYLIGVSRGISSVARGLFNWLGHYSIRTSETKQVVISLLIAIMMFGGVSVNGLWGYYGSENPDWRSVAEYLKINAHSNDVILVKPWLLCFLHYYRESSKNARILSPPADKLFSTNLSSIDARIWFVTSDPPYPGVTDRAKRRILLNELRNWVNRSYLVVTKRFARIVILHRPKGLILVSTKVGFKYYNDSVTLNVLLPTDANYTVALRARSSNESTLELIVDGVSKSSRTFIAERLSHIEFCTFFLESGSHNVTIVNRSELSVKTLLDKVAVWPKG